MTVVTDEREFCEVQEINQRIRLDMPGGNLDEILMVCANERNITSNMADRSINVHGTAGVDIVFCTDTREIHSHCMELPFTQAFILPDNGKWQVIQSCFSIEDVGFDISGTDALELCIKLKIKSHACKLEEITCTDALNVTKYENVRKAPITLYYTQPNDSLWSIAKQYRIPLSRLAADNGIDVNGRPEIGKRLFIMN
jgi:LysM repeat protein